MSGQWKEVVRLSFKGQRFRDHALDLSAITELSLFQKIVAETAKTLWKAANPDRERIPRNFEDRTRLCLRRIEDGSAVAPLEVYLEDQSEPELFEPEATEVKHAVELAEDVFRAVERDESLPEIFPKSLIPDYEKFGQTLSGEESIEVSRFGAEHHELPVRVTPITRSRLTALAERYYEDQIQIVGEVLEADVRQRRFQLWVDDKSGINVTFSPDQEGQVTSALRDHQTIRLRVVGRGEFSQQGKPVRVTRVDEIQVQPPGQIEQTSSLQSIETLLAGLASQVPKDEWDRLPTDLSNNLDHYLYGISRK